MERTDDKKKKTSLSFRSKRISLKIIHKLWQASGEGQDSNSLRIYKYTIDHFLKNDFN